MVTIQHNARNAAGAANAAGANDAAGQNAWIKAVSIFALRPLRSLRTLRYVCGMRCDEWKLRLSLSQRSRGSK